MADRLSVDLDQLGSSATVIAGHAVDLADNHRAGHQRMSSAAGGWIGRSSGALAEFSAQMKRNSDTLVNRLDRHSSAMHSAVRSYDAGEQRGARDMNGLR